MPCGTSADAVLNEGVPSAASSCSVPAPYGQPQSLAQGPAAEQGPPSVSCGAASHLSWAGGLLPHMVSEPPTLYTELNAPCGSLQR